MTRKELYQELKRIDGFIEVLQVFLKDKTCQCISQVHSVQENFRHENHEQLLSLIKIRDFLMPLKDASDSTLEKIHYIPVKFSCQNTLR